MTRNLDDAEFETLVRLLDQAMASQDARVQDALRNLLVITSLTATEQSKQLGPIAKMHAQVQSLTQTMATLERRVHDLERSEWESRRLKSRDDYWLGQRMAEYKTANWPQNLPGSWTHPNPNSDI